MTRLLRITGTDYERLSSHLFRADHDEHGAIILAGKSGEGTLLARELHLLDEGDFPAGSRGYRQFSSSALARLGARAASERLALLTCHSHPGATRRNRLSDDDRAGHRRVFPHLLDIINGYPVGGIAFGTESAAGEIWDPDGRAEELAGVEVIGHQRHQLRSSPVKESPAASRFDRQARLFGADGQAILRAIRVAVIGLGGGGSMVTEQLAHLGVGEIVAVDFDVVKEHNLSRIVGSTPADARQRRKKVDVARDVVRRIDDSIKFYAIDGDLSDVPVAAEVARCDFIFLCTDTITSRLVANAIVHSHFVPMVQIGAKVDLRDGGRIETIYVAVRPVLPGRGCLACAGLIDPVALQHEAASDQERAAQNYLGLPEVIDPSVVTLNGIGASAATNVMLMTTVGLAEPDQLRHRLLDARSGNWLALNQRKDPQCMWCGTTDRSRFGRGDAADLPTRLVPVPDSGEIPDSRGRLRSVFTGAFARLRR